MTDSTIFEQIIAKEISADIVYEDDDIMAFHDIMPQAPVHILVIPKIKIRDFAGLQGLEDAFVGRMFKKTADLAARMGLRDYRVVSNCGAGAGQSVFYLHLHILGGRSFSWPPG
ncbi:histidine triad nucleotide-binding protein [Candidatus Haliotispira prima]|uniref:Histidine triad nucleotide-binding protein n=1 Tax=Candidatus Haliotispira prima TaxID=3034016 RepID=A0ABY8MFT9_9SPIO|nr:histidine triad nucleotide-binding protein [Candidatus Haliotispira prima]